MYRSDSGSKGGGMECGDMQWEEPTSSGRSVGIVRLRTRGYVV
jgi:hypothetical protein